MYGYPSILVVASDKDKQHKLASTSANILSSIYLQLSAEWGPLFIFAWLHTHTRSQSQYPLNPYLFS